MEIKFKDVKNGDIVLLRSGEHIVQKVNIRGNVRMLNTFNMSIGKEDIIVGHGSLPIQKIEEN